MLKASVVKIIGKNTVKVVVVESKVHPLYKKVVYSKKFFMCHCSDDIDLKNGMKVEISECRPYSKMKKHRIVSVVL